MKNTRQAPPKKIVKMEVVINPFTKEIKVLKGNDGVELSYEDTDEWIGFKIDGKEYDLHILYDSGLDISIYKVVNNKVDYSTSVKKIVTVKY